MNRMDRGVPRFFLLFSSGFTTVYSVYYVACIGCTWPSGREFFLCFVTVMQCYAGW